MTTQDGSVRACLGIDTCAESKTAYLCACVCECVCVHAVAEGLRASDTGIKAVVQ